MSVLIWLFPKESLSVLPSGIDVPTAWPVGSDNGFGFWGEVWSMNHKFSCVFSFSTLFSDNFNDPVWEFFKGYEATGKASQ